MGADPVALALGLVLVVGACGSEADAPAGSTTGPMRAATGIAADEGPRQLTDVLGPVEVPARAERVVADSVGTLAHLWALGIVPIGAAIPVDISPAYIGAGAMEVPNLVAGDGWTLDVESVLAADPDLVVAVGADYNLENCERYKAATATYCFTDGWATAEDIEATFREIAVAVGREDEAEEVIDAYEARKAALAERIADTDLAERSIAVVRFDAGGFVGVRVEDQSLGVLRELGLEVQDWGGAPTDRGLPPAQRGDAPGAERRGRAAADARRQRRPRGGRDLPVGAVAHPRAGGVGAGPPRERLERRGPPGARPDPRRRRADPGRAGRGRLNRGGVDARRTGGDDAKPLLRGI
jgi:iron complex transport system substrate-binding protein